MLYKDSSVCVTELQLKQCCWCGQIRLFRRRVSIFVSYWKGKLRLMSSACVILIHETHFTVDSSFVAFCLCHSQSWILKWVGGCSPLSLM